MKTFVAYNFGLLGFLMQSGAVIGLPVYVYFFHGSSLWLFAFVPLGLAGMVPLSIMSSMLKKEEIESKDPIWGDVTDQNAEAIQHGFIEAVRRADLDKYADTNALPSDVVDTICDVANEVAEEQDLHPVFVILLAHQYVDADRIIRQLHKSRWVSLMISRSDYAPPPESYMEYIKSTYFSGDE